jgi:O-antigen ligase
MKSGKITRIRDRVLRPLEILFPLIPFVALIPNFFAYPLLSYNGLATQEMCYAWLLTIVLIVKLVQVMTYRDIQTYARSDLLMFGSLTAFILWQAVGLFWTPDKSEGIRALGIWLGFGILLAAGMNNLREVSVKWMLRSIYVVIALLLASQFYEYIKYKGEMLGIFYNHGIVSELLALMLPLLVTIYLTVREIPKALLALLMAGVTGLALLLTLRRGAMAGALVAILIILVATGLRWLRLQTSGRIVVAVLLMLLAAAPMIYLRRDAIITRFEGATQIKGSEGGLVSRLRFWAVGWEMAKQHLVRGIGTGGYQAVYGDYRHLIENNPAYVRIVSAADAEDGDEIHSPNTHNEYLQVLAENGLIGLLLFAIFWVMVIWKLWKARRSIHSDLVMGALAGLIAFRISAIISDFGFHYTPGPIILSCLLSAAFAVMQESEEAALENPSDEAQKPPKSDSVTLPRFAIIGLIIVLLAASVAFIWRTHQVYLSNALQGGQSEAQRLDFKFSFEPGENDVILSKYREVLHHDPFNAGAHLGTGLLLYQMKRIDESIPHVEYALHHGYGRPFARLLQAFNYEQAGRLPDAVRLMEFTVTAYPRSIPSRLVFQEFLSRTGNVERARQQQAALDQMDKQQVRIWQLALTMKPEAAQKTAEAEGLPAPETLSQVLLRALVQARAYHFLK